MAHIWTICTIFFLLSSDDVILFTKNSVPIKSHTHRHNSLVSFSERTRTLKISKWLRWWDVWNTSFSNILSSIQYSICFASSVFSHFHLILFHWTRKYSSSASSINFEANKITTFIFLSGALLLLQTNLFSARSHFHSASPYLSIDKTQ